MKIPRFKTRGFQLDLGRQPERLPTLKRMVEHAARYGFNQCHLYLENSLRLDAFGPAARGLRKDEMAELIAYAAGVGIEIVPSLNLLCHAEHFLEHEAFKEMDEVREGARQPWQPWHICFCPSLPRTREWVRQVIAEVAALFPSPNLHVGLDETWPLGSCPLCRARVAEIGLGGLFADYAAFLNETVKANGRRMWMWADMCFYYEGVIPRMPRDIVMVDWHYGQIGDRPTFSFRNWQSIDSTRELVKAGFTVVAGGSLLAENLTTFARYVHGLGVDAFLATHWEGSLMFPESILPALCQAGQLLKTGTLPDWRTAGGQLLPDCTEAQQQAFLLAIQAGDTALQPALEVLRGRPDCLVHQAARCSLLQRFVRRESADIITESELAARQVLRRGSDAEDALAPISLRLEAALAVGREWLALLEDLARRYGEREEERAIHREGKRLVEGLVKRHAAIEAFCKGPGVRTFFGNPVELVLDVVVVDPCAHACRIDVGDREAELRTVHSANTLPLGREGMGQLRVPLAAVPRFVRISINGYARVGVATVRIRTLESDGLMPKRICACGGAVMDAEHLMVWDRKAALFNEPDIAAKWLTPDVTSDNYVLLEY